MIIKPGYRAMSIRLPVLRTKRRRWWINQTLRLLNREESLFENVNGDA
jgi:hypothetical protein